MNINGHNFIEYVLLGEENYKNYKCINCGLLIFKSKLKENSYVNHKYCYFLDENDKSCNEYIIKSIVE